MNINKLKNRNRFTNENVESILCLATTKIESNIKTIVKSMECHIKLSSLFTVYRFFVTVYKKFK